MSKWKKPKKPTPRAMKSLQYCGDCLHCTIDMEPHTFSVQGKPTLGTCPHWTESPRVLLSQFACDKFEPRDGSR